MPAAAVEALRSLLEVTASDGSLDPGEKVRDLRAFRADLIALTGLADSYIGDQELRRESAAMVRQQDLVEAQENADIRDEMIRRGLATAAELDAAGYLSHDDLDSRAADGTLEEALVTRGAARKVGSAFNEMTKRDHGKFSTINVAGAGPKAPVARGAAPPKLIGMGPEALKREAEASKPRLSEDPRVTAQKSVAGMAAGVPSAPSAPAAAPAGPEGVQPDKDGWHDVGSDVNMAADLLSEGKKVRLSQPREASTLLGELAKRVQEAKAQGADAPVFDLCKVTVKNTNLFCAESKGIPRVQMPQLGGAPTPGSKADSLPKDAKGGVDLSQHFREHLAQMGHPGEAGTEKASFLRASQIELDGGKVGGMVGALEQGANLGGNSIFVSSDDYIVDGHHRWAAQVGHDLADGQLGDVDMPIERVDMPITELLDEANKFAADWGIPQKGIGAPQAGAADEFSPPKGPAQASAGTAPAADAGREAIDTAVKAMYRPEDAEPVKQNFESLDALFEAATADNEGLKTLLTDELPDMLGASVPSFEEALASAKDNPSQPQILMGPMKKKARSAEKVEANYDGDVNELKDVIRATVLVGGAGDLPGALDAVRARAEKQGWAIKGAEDKYSDGPPPPWVKGPTSAGYSDTKVYLVSPSGVAAELQFNTNSMFIAKEGKGHKLYEEQRSLQADVKARVKLQGGDLPERSGLYFNTDKDELQKKYGGVDVKEVPLEHITPDHPASADAKPFMVRAGLRQGDKRDPITLVKQADGSHKVHDGNSTFAAASEAGWGSIPAIVVDSDEQAKRIEEIHKAAKAEKKWRAGQKSPGTAQQSKGTRKSDTITVEERSRIESLLALQKALYGAAREASYA